jgi:succinate dehydrogenase/fumarate reductase-like Fe-S protein
MTDGYNQDILFIFNAQHNCRRASCGMVDAPIVQGRDQTARKQKVIAHTDEDHFILNLHALHNTDLIRETLPAELTTPKPIFPDRWKKHREFAAELRISGPAKRAAARAKAKATREKNKQASK